MNRKINKNTAFYMRASESDKSNIAKLAKHLGIDKSQAVRLAVENMLKSGSEKKADTSTKKAA